MPIRAAPAKASAVERGLRLACRFPSSLHIVLADQGRRVLRTLASFRRLRTCDRLRCGVLVQVSGNLPPVTGVRHVARSVSPSSVAAFPASLVVRDVAGCYRAANPAEVLQAALRVLAGQLRGSEVLSSSQAVASRTSTRR